MSSAVRPDSALVRAQFSSITPDFAFLENAGGSQVPDCVADGVRSFFAEDCVQTGGFYRQSERCTASVEGCRTFINRIFNGEETGYVAVGPSATALFNVLANAIEPTLKPGDEIIIAESNHESNIGPWERLSRSGATVKFWQMDPETGLTHPGDLSPMLSERTRIVAFPQTCNLIGDNLDVAKVVEMVHEAGAIAVVDVVAAASHVAPDVRAWNADFCVLSCYKVYGPHFAAMYGRADRWAELKGPNHKQLPVKGANKFELGCLPYELMAGYLKLGEYFGLLAGIEVEPGAPASRTVIEKAFSAMQPYESAISVAMLGYLNSRSDLRVLGSKTPGAHRHPTFSFMHRSKSSEDIARELCREGFGIKHGHFYAWRACEAVGIQPDPGVVRVSAVHYNTVDEIQRLCLALEQILG